MPNIEEKQRQLKAQLSALKTAEVRLAWLVERAKQSPPLPAELRNDSKRVPGCLARLWLVSDFRDGRCHFACDSDSLIVKAVAGLLCEFYSGQPPSEILTHSPDFLAVFGITQHLTPNRRNSLSRVWDNLRKFAEEMEHASRSRPESTDAQRQTETKTGPPAS